MAVPLFYLGRERPYDRDTVPIKDKRQFVKKLMKLLDKKSAQFSEIYSDYYSPVFGAVYTKVGNANDAEDITHEIFARFFENMDSIENYRKWLFGAMRNVVLEYYRVKKPDYNIDDVFQDVALTFVNGFRDTRIIINEAFESDENFKDEADRIIFDMIAIQNTTYETAGKRLGFTRNQVKYRYFQMVNRITEYLKQKGIKSLEDLL